MVCWSTMVSNKVEAQFRLHDEWIRASARAVSVSQAEAIGYACAVRQWNLFERLASGPGLWAAIRSRMSRSLFLSELPPEIPVCGHFPDPCVVYVSHVELSGIVAGVHDFLVARARGNAAAMYDGFSRSIAILDAQIDALSYETVAQMNEHSGVHDAAQATVSLECAWQRRALRAAILGDPISEGVMELVPMPGSSTRGEV